MAQPSANGPLIDSTADAIFHESLEAITDPDGTAWWNSDNAGSLGSEVADLCDFFFFEGGLAVEEPTTLWLTTRFYSVAMVYNNARHACTAEP